MFAILPRREIELVPSLTQCQWSSHSVHPLGLSQVVFLGKLVSFSCIVSFFSEGGLVVLFGVFDSCLGRWAFPLSRGFHPQ